MKKSFVYFFILLISFFSTKEGVAKTMHAILVADTIHDITKMTMPDIDQLHVELCLVAKQTNLKLNEKIFIGTHFTKNKLVTYLQNLKLTPSDIVIFHFSGHGYRTKQKAMPWPYLAFDFSGQFIDLQWIADAIWTKGPQFALIIADCCNNYVEKGFNNESKDIFINKTRYKPSKLQGYQALFAEAKGCIIISSCRAGQFSYGSRFGGLYTHYFLNHLNKEIEKTKPSWNQILKNTSNSISHIQNPVYTVSITRLN